MSPYSKPFYFIWLTFLFVFSMLFLICCSDLFFVMLGWDGLGLISFFLIVYFQNQSSIYSGLFTVLMNRIGDAFFLVLISVFFINYPLLFAFSSEVLSVSMLFLIFLTFSTKSAIFPFSSWLPLAMSAPTPISALVHSSTLVTAGLFLLLRHSYLLYSSPLMMNLMILLGLFTSFYSGLNSIAETDFKKLIALSTLSHLGFILTALGSGLIQLAFFHLLAHALFKSLLFMTMGDIMISLQHSQDIRYLSSGTLMTPFSSNVMVVSLLNLLGIPSLSGYFSKDLILESFNYSHSSVMLTFILYCNLFFTYFYSLKLFFYSFKSSLLNPFQQFHSPNLLHSSLLLLLSVTSVIGGTIILNVLFPFLFFPPLPLFLKLFPFFLMSLIIVLNMVMLKPINLLSTNLIHSFSSMLYLTPFISLFSYYSFNYSITFNKTLEQGSFFTLIGGYLSTSSRVIAHTLVNQSMLHPIKGLMVFALFTILLVSLS